MAKLDNNLNIRLIGAAGGVPNWAYAAYLLIRKEFTLT